MVRTEINKVDYLGNLCRSPGLDYGGSSAYILEVEQKQKNVLIDCLEGRRKEGEKSRTFFDLSN